MATSVETNPHRCGHPRHHDFHYQFGQGRRYAQHVLAALTAAHTSDELAAEAHIHRADRLLWQHAGTCEDDLRDFIAGLANAADAHLEQLGIAVPR